MKIQVTACDIDRATPATTFEVTTEGETVVMDLCAEHARPVYDLIEQIRGKADDAPAPSVAQSDEPAAQSTPRSRAPRTRKTAQSARKADGRRKATVTTMEEIEAQLREQEAKG
ncbi:hypothetical protein [Streptomyces sp. NPDC048623]|uniref:hypothetical protein n=1 Tax=Streptomyces sp. NPDC048623 TaxID=3155761 RepID=UPI0034315107